MAVGDIIELIRDWRKGKRRKVIRSAFARDPELFRQFVYTVACLYIPRIRRFIISELTNRKVALKAWKQLVSDLEDYMRMMDFFDPTRKTLFFAAILIARSALQDKRARKAFEQSKEEPTDLHGNPEFVSSIALSLDTTLDQTFHALTGTIGKNLQASPLRMASQPLQNALEQGRVRELQDIKILLTEPLLVVEHELEKFHAARK